MKFQFRLRIFLLFAIAFIFETAQSAQLSLNFVKRTAPMARFPAIQLDWLILTAKNFTPQLPEVQDAVAQMVQDSYAKFSSLDNRGKNKLIKVYKKLLTSPLLRTEQKDFLTNTILPEVTAQTQPLTPTIAKSDDIAHAEQIQSILTAKNLSSTTAVAAIADNIATAEPAAPASSPANPTAVTLAAPIISSESTQIPGLQRQPTLALAQTPQFKLISEATPSDVTPALAPSPTTNQFAATTIAPAIPSEPTQIPGLQRQPTLALAQTPQFKLISEANPSDVTPALAQSPTTNQIITNTESSTGTTTSIPAAVESTRTSSTTEAPATSVAVSPEPINATVVSAIAQDPSKSVATKAVEITNIITTAPINTPVDSYTSSTVAQAVQDLYNAQTPGDAPHIATLLTASTQKPVLTPEQNTYVATTLIPATQQAVLSAATSGIPTTTTLTPLIAPVALQGLPSALTSDTIQQSATSLGSPVAMAATTESDLEHKLKNIYQYMQSVQGKNQTFDAQTHAAFGASLVEAFNQVIDVQSYMHQVLAAAQTTPLLNKAQQQYVRDTMLPNLDDVSATAPTKLIATATKKGVAQKSKKAKVKAKIPGATKKAKKSTQAVGSKGKKNLKKPLHTKKKLKKASSQPVTASNAKGG